MNTFTPKTNISNTLNTLVLIKPHNFVMKTPQRKKVVEEEALKFPPPVMRKKKGLRQKQIVCHNRSRRKLIFTYSE
jgi:hypothetical protein